MRILLDECLPRRLRKELPGHDVLTVAEMAWSGKKNGELLQLMVADGIEVFITADQGLRYQQHLSAFRVGVILFVSVRNRLPDLVPLMPAVARLLKSIKPGIVVEIGPDHS